MFLFIFVSISVYLYINLPFNWIYDMCSKHTEVKIVFTKTEMNNERNLA